MKDIQRPGNTMTGISITVEGNHIRKAEDTESVHRNLHKTQQEEFVGRLDQSQLCNMNS